MLKKSKLVDVLFSLTVFYLQWHMVITQGAPCTAGAKAGPDNPEKLNKDIDKDKATGYLVYADKYVIKCCGTVKTWAFSVGKGTAVDLQIWRPNDKKNKEFELVGVNSYKISKKDKKSGSVSYDVAVKGLISVEENDVIGWYSDNDPVVEFAEDKDIDGIWKLGAGSSAKVGDAVDYSKGEKQSKRAYGVQITLKPNSPPKLDLLLATSIAMHAEIGTVVYTVHVLDDDPGDVKGLKLEMLNENEFFKFDPKTGVLSVGADITVPKEGKTYTFDFKLTDHCGAEDTGTLTVNVDYAERQTFPPKPTKADETDAPVTQAATTTEKDKKSNKDDDKDDGAEDKGDGEATTANSGSKVDDGDDKENGKDRDKDKKKDEPESTTTSTTYLPEFEDFTEPSNTTATGSRRRKPDIGLIAGIILGALALLVLIGAAVAIVLNKNAKAKAKVASKDVEKRAREAYAKSKGKPPPKNSVKPSGKANGDAKDKSSSKDNEKKTDKDSKSNTSKERSSQKADDKTTNKSNEQKKPSSDKQPDKKSPQSKTDTKPVMNGKSNKDK